MYSKQNTPPYKIAPIIFPTPAWYLFFSPACSHLDVVELVEHVPGLDDGVRQLARARRQPAQQAEHLLELGLLQVLEHVARGRRVLQEWLPAQIQALQARAAWGAHPALRKGGGQEVETEGIQK